MQRIICLLMLIPGVALANVCPNATPEMNQYQSQKTWVPHQVSQSGVTLKADGFLDDMNNFFLEGAAERVKQPVVLTVEGDKDTKYAFKKFCKNYEDRGFILTSFRKAQENNQFSLKLRYLPDLSEFTNDPFAKMKHTNFRVNLEIDGDSIVGQLPRANQLRQQAEQYISAQLSEETPVGEYNIELNNWDDLACDLVQGKAHLSINRDLRSQETFIEMEEVVAKKDVTSLYETWQTHLEPISDREELMFKAGVHFEGLRQQQKLGSFDADVALSMLQKVSKPNQKGIDWLGNVQLSCLSDSLQKYSSEYTQYGYNVIFAVDKDQSLAKGN